MFWSNFGILKNRDSASGLQVTSSRKPLSFTTPIKPEVGFARTNPFFWVARLIDWLVGDAFNIVTLFGGDPETARNSHIGCIIFAVGKFIVWLIGLTPGILYVLEFLEFRAPI